MAQGQNHRRVEFSEGDVKKHFGQKVYTRAPGSQEWVERPDLIATQISFALAPTIPSASLIRYYGSVIDPGEVTFEERERVSLNGHLVKIVIYLEDETTEEIANVSEKTWYGVIESDTDQSAGLLRTKTGEELPSGTQVFSAYGFEQFLRNYIIRTALTKTAVGDDLNIIEMGLTFNEGGKPNRSPGLTNLLCHAFVNDPDYDAVTNNAVLEFWRPKDILLYAVTIHPVRDGAGDNVFGLALDGLSILGGNILLPDARPVIQADGLSLYDLISACINPSVLSTWSLSVKEIVGGGLVATIKAHSLTATAGLPVDNAIDTVDFDCSLDPLTTLTVEEDGLERVDQVVVRGPKINYVFSCLLDSNQGNELKPLERDWTDADVTEYTEAGTPTGEIDQKRRQANEYRSKPRMRNVFTLYRIGREWRGFTVPPAGLSVKAVVDLDGVPHRPYRGAIRILPTLPLETPDKQPLESARDGIQVTSRNPAYPTKYIAGDSIQGTMDVGDFESESSSRMTIEAIVEDDRNLRILVSGEPQHSIAGEAYTKQDFDRDFPGYDYKKIWVTLAIEADLYVERRYPENVFGQPGLDARVKVVNLGDRDAFRVVYVASGTVESVDPTDGTLNYYDEGFAKNGAEDDSPFDKIGKLIYDYYVTRRRKVSIWTHRVTDDLKLGDMLLNVTERYPLNGGNVPTPVLANTAINEVVFDMPLGSGDRQASGPLVRYSTYAPDDIDPSDFVDSILGQATKLVNAAKAINVVGVV